MEDNRRYKVSIVTPDGQKAEKEYSAQDFQNKNVGQWLDENYAGQYSIDEFSPMRANDAIDAAGTYRVTVSDGEDSMTKDYDGATFHANQSRFRELNPNANIDVQRVRSVNNWQDLFEQEEDPDRARLNEINDLMARISQYDDAEMVPDSRSEVAGMVAQQDRLAQSGIPTNRKERKNLMNALANERLNNKAYLSDLADIRRDDESLASAQEALVAENPQAYKEYRIARSIDPANVSHTDKDFNKKIEELATARMYLQEAARVAESPSHYGDQNAIANMWKGLTGNLPDDFTPTKLTKNGLDLHTVEAIRKVQDRNEGSATNIVAALEGDTSYLTNEERTLLNAFIRKSDMEATRSTDMSWGYNAGKSFGQSLGFMMDFALTGGVAGEVAEGAVGGLVQKAGDNLLAKTAATMAQNLVKTAVMTPMMGSSYGNLIDNLLQMDDNYSVDLTAKNILKQVGDVLIENYTENAGDNIVDFGGGLLNKAGVDFSKMPWNRQGTMMYGIAHSVLGSQLKQAGFHGFLGEMSEEVYGSLLRTITGVDKDAWSQFWTGENLLTTVASFAPLTLFGMGTGAVQHRYIKGKYNKASDSFLGMANDENDRNILQSAMDSALEAETPEEMGTILREGIMNSDISGIKPDFGKVAAEYAKWASLYKLASGYQAEDLKGKVASLKEDFDNAYNTTGENGNEHRWYMSTENGDVVRVVTDAEGNEYFVTGDTSEGVAVLGQDGKPVFISEENIATDTGEIPVETYLGNMVGSQEQIEDEERMAEEGQSKIDEIKRKAVIGATFDMGTDTAPDQAQIMDIQPGGVYIVQTSEGVQQMNIEEIGRAMGISTNVMTHDEMVEAEAADYARKKDVQDSLNADGGFNFKYNDADLTFVRAIGVPYEQDGQQMINAMVVGTTEDGDMGETQVIPVPVGVLQSQKAVADAYSETEEGAPEAEEDSDVLTMSDGSPLPMRTKKNGEQVVDEKTLYNNDLEAYARYSDATYGEEETRRFLTDKQKALAKEIADIDKAIAKEKAGKWDDDLIDDYTDTRNQANARLRKVTDVLNSYAQADAVAAERAKAEQERIKRAEEQRKRELNEPQNLMQLAANFFKGDLRGKLNRESFKAETGFGKDELAKFFMWFAKKGEGMTIDDIADAVIEMDNDYGFVPYYNGTEQKDHQEAKNAVLAVIQSAQKPSDITGMTYAENEEYQRRLEEYYAEYGEGQEEPGEGNEVSNADREATISQADIADLYDNSRDYPKSEHKKELLELVMYADTRLYADSKGAAEQELINAAEQYKGEPFADAILSRVKYAEAEKKPAPVAEEPKAITEDDIKVGAAFGLPDGSEGIIIYKSFGDGTFQFFRYGNGEAQNYGSNYPGAIVGREITSGYVPISAGNEAYDKLMEFAKEYHKDETKPARKKRPARNANKVASNAKKVEVKANTLVTEERHEELVRRLKAKLGQLNSGYDPEMFALGAELAMYHIEKGARTFSAYAKAVIAEVGENARQYLKSWYNGARDLPGMEEYAKEMDSYEVVSATDVKSVGKDYRDMITDGAEFTLANGNVVTVHTPYNDGRVSYTEQFANSDGHASGAPNIEDFIKRLEKGGAVLTKAGDENKPFVDNRNAEEEVINNDVEKSTVTEADIVEGNIFFNGDRYIRIGMVWPADNGSNAVLNNLVEYDWKTKGVKRKLNDRQHDNTSKSEVVKMLNKEGYTLMPELDKEAKELEDFELNYWDNKKKADEKKRAKNKKKAALVENEDELFDDEIVDERDEMPGTEIKYEGNDNKIKVISNEDGTFSTVSDVYADNGSWSRPSNSQSYATEEQAIAKALDYFRWYGAEKAKGSTKIDEFVSKVESEYGITAPEVVEEDEVIEEGLFANTEVEGGENTFKDTISNEDIEKVEITDKELDDFLFGEGFNTEYTNGDWTITILNSGAINETAILGFHKKGSKKSWDYERHSTPEFAVKYLKAYGFKKGGKFEDSDDYLFPVTMDDATENDEFVNDNGDVLIVTSGDGGEVSFDYYYGHAPNFKHSRTYSLERFTKYLNKMGYRIAGEEDADAVAGARKKSKVKKGSTARGLFAEKKLSEPVSAASVDKKKLSFNDNEHKPFHNIVSAFVTGNNENAELMDSLDEALVKNIDSFSKMTRSQAQSYEEAVSDTSTFKARNHYVAEDVRKAWEKAYPENKDRIAMAIDHIKEVWDRRIDEYPAESGFEPVPTEGNIFDVEGDEFIEDEIVDEVLEEGVDEEPVQTKPKGKKGADKTSKPKAAKKIDVSKDPLVLDLKKKMEDIAKEHPEYNIRPVGEFRKVVDNLLKAVAPTWERGNDDKKAAARLDYIVKDLPDNMVIFLARAWQRHGDYETDNEMRFHGASSRYMDLWPQQAGERELERRGITAEQVSKRLNEFVASLDGKRPDYWDVDEMETILRPLKSEDAHDVLKQLPTDVLDEYSSHRTRFDDEADGIIKEPYEEKVFKANVKALKAFGNKFEGDIPATEENRNALLEILDKDILPIQRDSLKTRNRFGIFNNYQIPKEELESLGHYVWRGGQFIISVLRKAPDNVIKFLMNDINIVRDVIEYATMVAKERGMEVPERVAAPDIEIYETPTATHSEEGDFARYTSGAREPYMAIFHRAGKWGADIDSKPYVTWIDKDTKSDAIKDAIKKLEKKVADNSAYYTKNGRSDDMRLLNKLKYQTLPAALREEGFYDSKPASLTPIEFGEETSLFGGDVKKTEDAKAKRKDTIKKAVKTGNAAKVVKAVEDNLDIVPDLFNAELGEIVEEFHERPITEQSKENLVKAVEKVVDDSDYETDDTGKQVFIYDNSSREDLEYAIERQKMFLKKHQDALKDENSNKEWHKKSIERINRVIAQYEKQLAELADNTPTITKQEYDELVKKSVKAIKEYGDDIARQIEDNVDYVAPLNSLQKAVNDANTELRSKTFGTEYENIDWRGIYQKAGYDPVEVMDYADAYNRRKQEEAEKNNGVDRATEVYNAISKGIGVPMVDMDGRTNTIMIVNGNIAYVSVDGNSVMMNAEEVADNIINGRWKNKNAVTGGVTEDELNDGVLPPAEGIGTTYGEVKKSKHTKTGEDIWVVNRTSGSRLSKEEFDAVRKRAKLFGGYYSSFKSNKGFIFKSEEDANNFNNLNNNENVNIETTDAKTASDTAAIVREAGSIGQEAEVILNGGEGNAEEVVKKIDETIEDIDAQLALLGDYYDGESARTLPKLAAKLSADTGLEFRAADKGYNIVSAYYGNPTHSGNRRDVEVFFNTNYQGGRFADITTGLGLSRELSVRIANPTYAKILSYIRKFLPGMVKGENAITSGNLLDTAKNIAETNRKNGENSVSSREGDKLIDTLFEGETTAPKREELTEYNGYKKGEMVLFSYPGRKADKVKLLDFEVMGTSVRPIVDSFHSIVMSEVTEWEYITKLDGTTPTSPDKGTPKKELSAYEKAARIAFSGKVASEMINAVDTGERPIRSINDLRKLARDAKMEVDAEGSDDILLQELAEVGIVRAARYIVNSGKYGEIGSKECFDAIVRLYESQPTIAQRSSNRIAMGQYSTPVPMGYLADMFADGGKASSVFEPTAGNGMLVYGIPANIVHVNELDDVRHDNLLSQGFASVTNEDATADSIRERGRIYDAIIANPPFGSAEAKDYDGKMISGLDPQIAINALETMKDDGKAAIILGGNLEYAPNGSVKSKKAFVTYLYDHYNVKGIVNMGGSLFQRQGTTFETMMILIDGRRTDEERSQTKVYPPVQSKAAGKAETFDELFDIVNNIKNSNNRTDGTEVLRSSHGEQASDSLGEAGRGNGRTDNTEPGANDAPRVREGGRGTSSVERAQGERTQGVRGERGQNAPARTTGNEAEADLFGDEGRGGESDVQRMDAVGVSTAGVGLETQEKKKPREIRKRENEKRELGQEKLHYRPHNNAFSLESVAPAAMVESMDSFLGKIEEQEGDITDFVRRELGYNTDEELYNALAAEQVDSVAMAIYHMKNGEAMIIGDQTGVGKGRQMAALVRWARRQGRKPVFVTQKADLFSDLYRDLVDIGSGDLRPFIFNSDGAMVDANGNKVYSPMSSAAQKKVFEAGQLPDNCDFAILTYSQVNTGDAVSMMENSAAKKAQGASRFGTKKSKASKEGKPTPKATFLRAVAKDNYMFLDESHTAAGESNTGIYLQSLVKDAAGVTFASATFAKRPDTMPLYAIRTAMSKANVKTHELIDIIKKGGVTLQEIMSRALTEAGQMVRRERDMRDVVTDWETITDPETVKRARENYDKTIDSFNDIIKFQETYIKPLIEERDQELAAYAESAGVKRGTDKLGVANVPFASKTYNYTKQLMLALKADAIADKVDELIEKGLHPVIALESTMEASIKDYAVGEEIAEPTFSASLLKGLDSVMQYTEKDEDGNETHFTYTPEELGEEAAQAYYALQDKIRESTADIFISPIDAIIAKINEKGYTVGELTGRNLYVEEVDGKTIVRKRTDKDKKRMQRDFNSGKLDVLILNKSASTGISLHASGKFSDQRQRAMIIAQPLSDINDYMQMIGRIDRTGQVHRGYYVNLGLPVPAESRFLMMLSTKLKSLNANTTTAQESESNSVDAPDLLNKYGSQVVVEYLRDNPEVYEKIGSPLKKGKGEPVKAEDLDSYNPQEDDARRITGYVALLSTDEQEQFYNDVTERYRTLIKYLDDTGANDLKITVMPLRAQTIEKAVSSPGLEPDGNNPFAKDAYVEKVQMDVLRKPMSSKEVKATIAQLNDNEEHSTHIKKVLNQVEKERNAKLESEEARYASSQDKLEVFLDKRREKIFADEKKSDAQKEVEYREIERSNRDKIKKNHEAKVEQIFRYYGLLNNLLKKFVSGVTYLIENEMSMFDRDNAYVPAIFCGYKTKKEGIKLSTSTAVFATLDGRRKLEYVLSSSVNALDAIKALTMMNSAVASKTSLDNWDENVPKDARKEGYILTGNIIQAMSSVIEEDNGDGTVQRPGQLISFTDIDGNIRDGVLMPDAWDPKYLKKTGVPVNARLEDLRAGDELVGVSHQVSVENVGAGDYKLWVPKEKSTGGQFFLNNRILSLVNGGVFTQSKGRFVARVSEDNIKEILDILASEGVRVYGRGEQQTETGFAPADIEAELADMFRERSMSVTPEEEENQALALVDTMQEYVDSISDDAHRAKVVTYGTAVEYARSQGVSEDDIETLEEGIEGRDVAGFHAGNGTILLFANGLYNIDNVRRVYVHEREHDMVTDEQKQSVLDILGEDKLRKAVHEMFNGFYDGVKNPLALAEEFICKSMEYCYSAQSEVELYATMALNGVHSRKIVNFIKTIDDEQRKDTGLSKARRGANGRISDEGRAGNVQQGPFGGSREVGEQGSGSAERGPEETEGRIGFSPRTGASPKEVKPVWKLMRLGKDGLLYPLYIDRNTPGLELKKWYNADSPQIKDLKNLEAGYSYLIDKDGNVIDSIAGLTGVATNITGNKPSKELINEASAKGMRWIGITHYADGEKCYVNIGISGSKKTGVGGVAGFAMRPGWHAGSLPSMKQIKARSDDMVWVKGYVAYGNGAPEEAASNPHNEINDHIPYDGGYSKATSSFNEQNVDWYISGAFMPVEIMSDADARKAIDKYNAKNNAKVPYDIEREGGKMFNAKTRSFDYPSETSVDDKAYLDAVERGDMETAQKMVVAAAKKAMPNTKVVDEDGNPLIVYHGTREMFNVFDPERRPVNGRTFGDGFYFSSSRELAERFASKYVDSQKVVVPAFLNIEDIVDIDAKGKSDWRAEERRQQIALWNEKRKTPDGVVLRNINDGYSIEADTYMVRDNRNIKSAEPVTYDDNGKVIPLSQRFNTDTDDIRFREDEPIFYSNALRAVEQIEMKKGNAQSWINKIQQKGGLKKDEDKWLGLSVWLKEQKGDITRDEVLDYINSNVINIEEVNYSDGAAGLTSDDYIKSLAVEHTLDFRDDFMDAFMFDFDYDNGNPDEYVGGVVNYSLAVALYNNANGTKFKPADVEEIEDRIVGWANKVVEESKKHLGGVRKMDSTRELYTTDGLENKREIALTVPNIESWNESDTLHFGDAGNGRAVAWARFGEVEMSPEFTSEDASEFDSLSREIEGLGTDMSFTRDRLRKATGEEAERLKREIDEISAEIQRLGTRMGEISEKRKASKGSRVLVIDEIQSKRHQEAEKVVDKKTGRRKGYRTPLTNEEKARLDEIEKEQKMLADESERLVAEWHNTTDQDEANKIERKVDEIQSKIDANVAERTAIKTGKNVSGVAPAPFENNWAELAMKRMLRLAVEEGYDKIAWTNGTMQAERYNLTKFVDTVELVKDENGIRRYDLSGKGALNSIYVDSEGNVTESDFGGVGSSLSAVVGTEMAEQMSALSLTDDEDDAFLDLDGKVIGGRGMVAFYDQKLVNWMNKYAKQWGAKVEDINIPGLANEEGWHSVTITPAMRESVMKGQPMFRPADTDLRSADPLSYSQSTGAKRHSVEETARKAGVDINIVSRDEMPDGHRFAKGYWKNGKCYVCLENHNDAEDAARTVLHEGVGHEGLRRLVGEENFRQFLTDVRSRLSKDAQREIAQDAIRRGGRFDIATEEYLAGFAEKMDIDREVRRNVFDILRSALRSLLSKVGISIRLTDRDIMWLMWQSRHANDSRTILNEAKRQSVANRLGFSLHAQEVSGILRDEMRARENGASLSAARLYNKDVINMWSRLHEVWVDKDDAVLSLKKAIEKTSSKGEAKPFEDVALALNQQSSRGLAAIEKWERKYWEPLTETIKEITDELGIRVEDVERYMMVKHGLERNEKLAQRDARDHYQAIYDAVVRRINDNDELDDDEREKELAKAEKALQRHLDKIKDGSDTVYLVFRQNDYSGLISMFSEYQGDTEKDPVESEEEYNARMKRQRIPMYDSLEATEEAARKEVEEFEQRTDKTDTLWERTNAATKATLEIQYKGNVISRDSYMAVSEMFDYYVPLRGFKDKTAEDMYNYYTENYSNSFVPTILMAKGRRSEAASPLGFIGAQASSAVAQAEKNNTKLALYYFVSNRADNDIVTISDVWYERKTDPITGDVAFEAVYPPLSQDLSSEGAKQFYNAWEEGMKEKAKRGEAFKRTNKLKLGKTVAHIDAKNEDSHIIKFKVGGRDMMMFINGNPRAAEAINNQLNIEVSGDYQKFFGKILRYFSGINTSYNPEFWISNLQRDLMFSMMSVSVKEDGEYNRKFHENLRSNLGAWVGKGRNLRQLMKAYEEETLGDSEIEQYYREFVENGGVTGYTTLRSNDEWEQMVRKAAGEEKKAIRKIGDMFDKVAEFGEAFEQMTRFTAYLTSRQMGKEVRDAVADAKELTVNFNRKGSGKVISLEEANKLRNNKNQPLSAVEKAIVIGLSYIPAYGRRAIMFFNAGVQGLNAMYQLAKRDGKSTATWLTAYAAAGALTAILHALIDDDDDYLDIPDYERRNNALLGANGVYMKWALPQEARGFYALGDFAVNWAMGREVDKSKVGTLFNMLADVAPINPSEGLSSLVPSAVSPFVEIALNKDYKGSKIHPDNKYRSEEEKKTSPKYQEVFNSTGRFYVGLAQLLNSISGGDAYDSGFVNIYPDSVEHLVEGYTGGAGTTIEKFVKGVMSTTGGAIDAVTGLDTEKYLGSFSVRSTPFISRLVTVNDERYRNAHVNDLYWYYRNEATHTDAVFKKAVKNGDDRKIDELMNSGRYDRMNIYESYEKSIKAYNDLLKITDDQRERKELMAEQDELKKEMIYEISNLR